MCGSYHGLTMQECGVYGEVEELYPCGTCDLLFSDNEDSPDEKMLINCSEKDNENREAEHEEEREKEHEEEEAETEDEENQENEKEDREEWEKEEEFAVETPKRKMRKSVEKTRKRTETKT